MCDGPKVGNSLAMCENMKEGQCVWGTEIEEGTVLQVGRLLESEV